jgi:hypothetical protein
LRLPWHLFGMRPLVDLMLQFGDAFKGKFVKGEDLTADVLAERGATILSMRGPGREAGQERGKRETGGPHNIGSRERGQTYDEIGGV